MDLRKSIIIVLIIILSVGGFFAFKEYKKRQQYQQEQETKELQQKLEQWSNKLKQDRLKRDKRSYLDNLPKDLPGKG